MSCKITEYHYYGFIISKEIWVKNSLQLDDVMEVPNTAKGNIFISEKIVKMTQDRLTQQAELITEYNNILKKADKLIKNAENLNLIFEELSGLKEIWDSKRQINKTLMSEAANRNLVYNKELKQFEEQ